MDLMVTTESSTYTIHLISRYDSNVCTSIELFVILLGLFQLTHFVYRAIPNDISCAKTKETETVKYTDLFLVVDSV